MPNINSIKIIALLFIVTGFLSPGRAAAVCTVPYLMADSTTTSLAIKKNGEVKERIYVGEEVRIKATDQRLFTGSVVEIQASYLLVGSSKAYYRDIDWIKVKKKKPKAHTVLKWVGIAAGIAVLGVITFMTIFIIAYGGGGGGAYFLGVLLIAGLATLFGTLVSRKKYRLNKYELEVQETGAFSP